MLNGERTGFYSAWRLLAACLLLLPVLGCVSSGGQTAISDRVAIEFLYATDRNIIGSGDQDISYGNRRGDLTFGVGTAAIDLPKNGISAHSLSNFRQRRDAVSYQSIEILQLDKLQEPVFLEHLSDRIEGGGDKSALLYIHGFGRAFERVAKTLAILAYGMDYEGTPVLYSWPSNGSAFAYVGDVTTIDWSTLHLRRFIEMLVEQHEVNTLHVVAHSLGNRAFLNAFVDLINNQADEKEWKFGEIALVAPDVDQAIFKRDILPVISDVRSRVTLYISSQDLLLRLSNSFNLYPRVGDGRAPPVVAPGIETVDVTSAAGLSSGHSYYRETPEVLDDLSLLLNQRLGASERSTLEPVISDYGLYWKVRDHKIPEEELPKF